MLMASGGLHNLHLANAVASQAKGISALRTSLMMMLTPKS